MRILRNLFDINYTNIYIYIYIYIYNGKKVKIAHHRPEQPLRVPGSWESQISRQSAQNVVRLSALPTGRIYLPGNIPGTHFCWKLSRPPDHSADGSSMSMKNCSYTFGNQTHDLPACSAVPQPTTLRYALTPKYTGGQGVWLFCYVYQYEAFGNRIPWCAASGQSARSICQQNSMICCHLVLSINNFSFHRARNTQYAPAMSLAEYQNRTYYLLPMPGINTSGHKDHHHLFLHSSDPLPKPLTCTTVVFWDLILPIIHVNRGHLVRLKRPYNSTTRRGVIFRKTVTPLNTPS